MPFLFYSHQKFLTPLHFKAAGQKHRLAYMPENVLKPRISVIISHLKTIFVPLNFNRGFWRNLAKYSAKGNLQHW